MKRKRKKLPGMTLVELVIVLAIFSGIAVGALAMIRPAMNLYNKTVNQEKAIAAVDSISRYMQESLSYADKMMVFDNTGITDIDEFIECPFRYKEMGKTVLCQTYVNSFSPGDYDNDHYANPVSYFSAYYFAETIDSSKRDAYFKDKVVYVMDIGQNAAGNTDVNIYGYPLADTYANVVKGNTEQYWNKSAADHVEPTHSRVNTDLFKGVDSVVISAPVFTSIPEGGMKCTVTVNYKGATNQSGILHYDNTVAMSFPNLIARKEVDVEDIFEYKAKTYEYFDWEGKSFNWSRKGGTYTCTGASGGHTYVVYTVPEIIPTPTATPASP